MRGPCYSVRILTANHVNTYIRNGRKPRATLYLKAHANTTDDAYRDIRDRRCTSVVTGRLADGIEGETNARRRLDIPTIRQIFLTKEIRYIHIMYI